LPLIDRQKLMQFSDRNRRPMNVMLPLRPLIKGCNRLVEPVRSLRFGCALPYQPIFQTSDYSLDAPDAPPQQQGAQRRQERSRQRTARQPADPRQRQGLSARGHSTQRRDDAEVRREKQERLAGRFSAFSLRLRTFASRWVTLQPDAYRSSGCSPVRLATRANMRGPISS